MNRRLKLLIVAMLCDAASCAGVQDHIDDVNLESARIVRVSNNPADSRIVRETAQSGAGTTRVFKIRFTTKFDLIAFAKKTGFNIASEVTACKAENGKTVRVGGGSVYLSGFQVSKYIDSIPGFQPMSESHRGPAGLKTYDVYASVKQQEITAGPAASPGFDYSSSAVDLCLRLRGGDMTGARFESNLVVIPRERLNDALRSIP